MLKQSIGVAAVAAVLAAPGAAATGAIDVDPSTGSTFSSTTGAAAATSGRPISCDGVLDLGHAPKTKVGVAEGASCTIVDSTIKSLQARDAEDVKVYDTEVTRNLMVRGATGTVHIGPKGCRYDPVVGNNVVVRNSHNVLICLMSVDNNITVRGNDGRVTVRDSSAGNNLRVSRNLAYAPTTGEPTSDKAAAIRLLRDTADNHIVARDNAAIREVIARGNSPVATVA